MKASNSKFQSRVGFSYCSEWMENNCCRGRRETFTILKMIFIENQWELTARQGLIDKSNPLNHLEEISFEDHCSMYKETKFCEGSITVGGQTCMAVIQKEKLHILSLRKILWTLRAVWIVSYIRVSANSFPISVSNIWKMFTIANYLHESTHVYVIQSRTDLRFLVLYKSFFPETLVLFPWFYQMMELLL